MRWIVPILIALAPVSAAIAHDDDSNRLSYVYFDGSSDSSMMSGNMDDHRRAKYLRGGRSPMLYVRTGGVAYVIRDAALLARAEAIMAPQRELGRQQGELGRQQGALGRQQGALGREQGRIGRMMAYTPPRFQGELGRQQGDLGRQQGELGRRQGELGRQQGALGREQGRLARLAEPQFRALVAEAIQRGVAQRAN